MTEKKCRCGVRLFDEPHTTLENKVKRRLAEINGEHPWSLEAIVQVVREFSMVQEVKEPSGDDVRPLGRRTL